MEKILVCVDGSVLSKAVCDYGVYLANLLNLPLVILNVVEHSHKTKKLDLSGNIGLGSRDELLEELVNEEMSESKKLIAKGRTVLKEMKEYVESKNFTNFTTLQKHGTLYETLDELSSTIRLAVIGLRGEDNQDIGYHVEELIRMLNIPILLVNKAFEPISSILIAYDGSNYAKKAIESSRKNIIFKDTNIHVVNIDKDKESSKKILDEVQELFEKSNKNIKTASLNGDGPSAILDYQKQNNLDIIAMGAYSHNRFRSAIFGSFTTQMLLNSKVPLLLFR